MSNQSGKWIFRSVLAVLFAAGLLGLSCVNICPLIQSVVPSIRIDVPQIVKLIQSLGGWGVAGSIGLMVLHTLIPFPAEILTMANGMVYGTFWGIVITWVGAMLGAYIGFGLTRLFGRPFVAKVVGRDRLRQLDAWVLKQGIVPLLLARLIPLISFNLLNYAAGMTKLDWWSFTWTTGLGILPMTVVMVVMGSSLRLFPWWVWLILLALFGLAVYALHSYKSKGIGS